MEKLSECGHDFFAAKCYVSAFLNSTRAVTYSLQSVLGNNPDFSSWYEQHKVAMSEDKLCRFFHRFRNINQHIGDNIVTACSSGPGEKTIFWFQPTKDIKQVPTQDVETACRKYLALILSVVYDCYCKFGPEIDAHQRYTAEYFASIGKTIEDAEEELGYPRGWTDIGDKKFIDYRWKLLRDNSIGCEINHIFEKYLDRTTPVPE